MAKDYLNSELTETRRRDRAIEDESWIIDFLHRAPFGALATVHDGQPFINTNIFAFDEDDKCIYTHTARAGRTQANVDNHQKVSFSLSEMGRFLPASEALEFSVEYAGVLVFGNAKMVYNEEATHGLKLIMAKYAPHLEYGKDYSGVTEADLKRTGVFKIEITAWSGKQKKVPKDFVGAYLYEDILPLIKR